MNVTCPLAVKAYNEHMSSVDLADQICRFYICTHKSSRKWYLQLFWFLVDLAINNAYIIESFWREHENRFKRKSREFRKQLATELLSMHSSRQRAGRQAQNVPARLVQRHFPDNLGTDNQCVVCSKSRTRRHIGMAVKIVEMFIYV